MSTVHEEFYTEVYLQLKNKEFEKLYTKNMNNLSSAELSKYNTHYRLTEYCYEKTKKEYYDNNNKSR